MIELSKFLLYKIQYNLKVKISFNERKDQHVTH